MSRWTPECGGASMMTMFLFLFYWVHGACVRHLKISTRISVFPAPHSAHALSGHSNSSVAR
jgi:hypothetical protein